MIDVGCETSVDVDGGAAWVVDVEVAAARFVDATTIYFQCALYVAGSGIAATAV